MSEKLDLGGGNHYIYSIYFLIHLLMMKERIQKQVQEAKLEPAEETESEDNSLV